ncbi:MAG TPA: antibiotic biosynthesis monooxygenase [Actinomycetota bacterium]|nr:antibiotic biosynthesis monooxygenase [Actinomycetota bacterium]
MYGTVAKMRVKPENQETVKKVMDAQMEGAQPAGYLRSLVLSENDSDVQWLFVVFEDRASYDANASDPAQHERYMEFRALMEADPEWHDGTIEEG